MGTLWFINFWGRSWGSIIIIIIITIITIIIGSALLRCYGNSLIHSPMKMILHTYAIKDAFTIAPRTARHIYINETRRRRKTLADTTLSSSFVCWLHSLDRLRRRRRRTSSSPPRSWTWLRRPSTRTKWNPSLGRRRRRRGTCSLIVWRWCSRLRIFVRRIVLRRGISRSSRGRSWPTQYPFYALPRSWTRTILSRSVFVFARRRTRRNKNCVSTVFRRRRIKSALTARII